jgi:hypothetical protein
MKIVNQNLAILISVLFLLAIPLVFAELVTVGDGDSGTITVDNGGSGIDVGPVYEDPCGNGIIDAEEQCDSGNLAGETCSSLQPGYTGTLSCTSSCTYDTSSCTEASSDEEDDDDNEDSGGGSPGGGGGGSASTTCIEKWECSNWSVCINSIQTRTCTDSNNCKTNKLKPALERSCISEETTGEEQGITSLNQTTPRPGILGAVIGGGVASTIGLILLIILIIAGISVFLVRKKKNPYGIKKK